MTYIAKPKFQHPGLPRNELGYTHRDYEGKVFLPRRVLQSLIGARPKAEDCVAHFHLNRTAFELSDEERQARCRA